MKYLQNFLNQAIVSYNYKIFGYYKMYFYKSIFNIYWKEQNLNLGISCDIVIHKRGSLALSLHKK